MPDSIPPAKSSNAPPAPGALAQALEALKAYDRGSGRAALLPIDQAAAAASLNDAPSRQQLEQQLVAILRAGGSVVAREYICAKLGLIGSEQSVPALSQLLAEAQLGTAARNALEALPCPQATQALRKALGRLHGLPKAGAINSLGNRREAASAGALKELLKDADPEVAGAAVAALGRIGSVAAGRALRHFYPKAPAALQHKTADAALNCAEHLLEAGQRAEAQALYRMLAEPTQPAHIQEAAQRGLRTCAA
ncbi:MAG: HEAT repeat domain-containing protein [Verrucomicrobiota bacterium]|jgi:HEAT repeat protein